MNRNKRQRRQALQQQLPDYSAWFEEHRDTRGLAALLAQLDGADAAERRFLLEESIPDRLRDEGLESYTSRAGVTVKRVAIPRVQVRPGKEAAAVDWLRERGFEGPFGKKLATFLHGLDAAIPHELFEFQLEVKAKEVK